MRLQILTQKDRKENGGKEKAVGDKVESDKIIVGGVNTAIQLPSSDGHREPMKMWVAKSFGAGTSHNNSKQMAQTHLELSPNRFAPLDVDVDEEVEHNHSNSDFVEGHVNEEIISETQLSQSFGKAMVDLKSSVDTGEKKALEEEDSRVLGKMVSYHRLLCRLFPL